MLHHSRSFGPFDVVLETETEITSEVGIHQRKNFQDAVIVLRPIEHAQLQTLESACRIVDPDRQSHLWPTHTIVGANRDAMQRPRLDVERRAPAANARR